MASFHCLITYICTGSEKGFGMSSWDPAWHSSIPAKRDMKKPNRNLCEKQYSADDFHTVQVRYVKSCVSLIYIDHFACLYRLL